MATNKRTIAVTGASGLIGSHLVPVLLGKGFRLRVLSRRLPSDSPGVEIIRGDIRSMATVGTLLRGCDAVIHLAGIAHTSLRSHADVREAEETNVGGTRNLLEAAQNAGVDRVLLTSSAFVYAGQAGTDLNEQSPTASDSFYARTKLAVEAAGLEIADRGRLSVVILRPCLTYGPGVRFNLKSLMRAIQCHYYFHIRGKSPMRSFLSVDNCVSGISHLLLHGENGKIYNLADEHSQLLVDFVNSLADLMRVPRPRSLPIGAVRAAVASTLPLQWMGLRSPINGEALRRLTQSFTLDVGALARTGFNWFSGSAAQKKMVDAYLLSLKTITRSV
jgi:nucleoside-diphosphate-sugar epimerase